MTMKTILLLAAMLAQLVVLTMSKGTAVPRDMKLAFFSSSPSFSSALLKNGNRCPTMSGSYCLDSETIIRCRNGVGMAVKCGDEITGEVDFACKFLSFLFAAIYLC
jgi:hypothetical protein